MVPELKVNSLAVAGGQQVAVGSADGYPAIWHRAAGGRWRLVSSPSLAASSGLSALTSVTHGTDGWLAVGVPGPVVLTSANGTTWQPAAGSIARDLSGVVGLSAAAGPGGYVIVGKEVDPDGSCEAYVWHSADLASWTRAHDVNDTSGSSQVLAVAADGTGFVSVGSHNGQPALWTTTNGTSWTTIVLPLPAGATGVLQQIAVNGGRAVAVGVQTSADAISPLAAVSADGGATFAPVSFGVPGTEPGRHRADRGRRRVHRRGPVRRAGPAGRHGLDLRRGDELDARPGQRPAGRRISTSSPPWCRPGRG